MILCGGSDSGELKSSEHDFRYLYWTISKILSANLFTCKGTNTTDWVGQRLINGLINLWHLCHRLIYHTWVMIYDTSVIDQHWCHTVMSLLYQSRDMTVCWSITHDCMTPHDCMLIYESQVWSWLKCDRSTLVSYSHVSQHWCPYSHVSTVWHQCWSITHDCMTPHDCRHDCMTTVSRLIHMTLVSYIDASVIHWCKCHTLIQVS